MLCTSHHRYFSFNDESKYFNCLPPSSVLFSTWSSRCKIYYCTFHSNDPPSPLSTSNYMCVLRSSMHTKRLQRRLLNIFFSSVGIEKRIIVIRSDIYQINCNEIGATARPLSAFAVAATILSVVLSSGTGNNSSCRTRSLAPAAGWIFIRRCSFHFRAA